jgi:hypothetical protein
MDLEGKAESYSLIEGLQASERLVGCGKEQVKVASKAQGYAFLSVMVCAW